MGSKKSLEVDCLTGSSQSEVLWGCNMGRPRKYVNVVGLRFGKIEVTTDLRDAQPGVVSGVCECGNAWVGKLSALTGGKTKSCGCMAKEGLLKRLESQTTHGMSGTVEHQAWKRIRQRCTNPSNKDYYLYGARGIKVCDRWMTSFEAFYADMGARPGEGYSIERRDSNEDYGPDNCYWATSKEQANNTSRNRLLTYNGVTESMSRVADRYGIPYFTLRGRIQSGWSVEDAIETPFRITKAGKMYEFDGISDTVSGWSNRLDIGVTTLLYRLNSGMTVEEAITTPVKGKVPDRLASASAKR